jgi:hypothetical protein
VGCRPPLSFQDHKQNVGRYAVTKHEARTQYLSKRLCRYLDRYDGKMMEAFAQDCFDWAKENGDVRSVKSDSDDEVRGWRIGEGKDVISVVLPSLHRLMGGGGANAWALDTFDNVLNTWIREGKVVDSTPAPLDLGDYAEIVSKALPVPDYTLKQVITIAEGLKERFKR